VSTLPVLFATNEGLPGMYADNQPLIPRLRRRGVDARIVRWDDPDVQWHEAGVVVVRSVWDAHLRPKEFLEWINHLEGVGKKHNVRIVNPTHVIRKFFDKTIMARMEDQDFDVVPTAWIPSENPVLSHLDHQRTHPPTTDLRSAIAQLRERDLLPGEVLVKPSISGLSYGTVHFDPANDEQVERAQHIVTALTNDGRAVMVQPYMPDFLDRETSYVFIRDPQMAKSDDDIQRVFSHAYVRPSKLEFGVDQSTRQRRLVNPDPRSLELARRAFSLAENATYARIDILHPGDDGRPPQLNEMELDSPNLEMRLGQARYPGAEFGEFQESPFEPGARREGDELEMLDRGAKTFEYDQSPYNRMVRAITGELSIAQDRITRHVEI
jgi:hypothetical protein